MLSAGRSVGYTVVLFLAGVLYCCSIFWKNCASCPFQRPAKIKNYEHENYSINILNFGPDNFKFLQRTVPLDFLSQISGRNASHESLHEHESLLHHGTWKEQCCHLYHRVTDIIAVIYIIVVICN
jgi:hypothetical protein